MNSKFYNGSIIPLSMRLELYGEKLRNIFSIYYILKFKLNPNGLFFKKDEFIIYISVHEEIHEGILFKNKEIFYRFKDINIKDNKFIRNIDNYRIYIDDFNVTYFEKLNKVKFITSSKSNVKLNRNIVTFDIETYIKEDKFIPFACG